MKQDSDDGAGFAGKPQRCVVAEMTLPDVSPILHMHGTRQTLTVTPLGGKPVKVAGLLSVYQFAGGIGGIVCVSP